VGEGPGVRASLIAFACALVACGPLDFPDESLINSVRILASRSDQPYAKPGATVRSQVLAVDARPDASGNEPMRIFWLPFVCINPPNDAYYACFSEFEQNPSEVDQYRAADGGGGGSIIGAISAWDGGAEAGVGGGLGLFADGGESAHASLASIPSGVDISPYLIQGTRVVFHLPSNIVATHPPTKGVTPYGLAVLFNIACAGHVELVPLDPTNPNPEQIPFGCFNSQHQQVSADDYVIGYTEVFAYDTLTNHNPVIGSFSFRDAGVPLDAGYAAAVDFPHCTDDNTSKCPDNHAITGIPDASWELDPQDSSDAGPLREQVWVDYYSTIGTLSDEAILIFDPVLGRVTAPEQENLSSITKKQHGTLWAVAHDNRGGASWITVPLNAQ
jgi:hypothetical protein